MHVRRQTHMNTDSSCDIYRSPSNVLWIHGIPGMIYNTHCLSTHTHAHTHIYIHPDCLPLCVSSQAAGLAIWESGFAEAKQNRLHLSTVPSLLHPHTTP